jgi:DNA polymerase-3 subunit delta'
MSFARIRGHPKALGIIRRALQAGRVPHALLFAGPEGVGKRQVALEVAKALNCAGPTAGVDGCDACPSCRLADRMAETLGEPPANRRLHPNIIVVAPEAGSRSLKIAQIREVERHATLSPYAGRRRVAILTAAETMTHEAANAFLKTLEEPPGGAVLILVAAAPTALLPTVRSRCQEVRFGPLPDTVLSALLAESGIDAEEAQRAAELGAAGVGQGKLWAEKFSREKQDQLLQDLWASLPSAARALAWATRWAKELAPDRARPEQDITPLAFLLLGTWTRHLAMPEDHARASSGGGGGAPWPGKGAVGRAAALALYGAVAEAQEALHKNANLRLTLEAMVLRMRRTLGDGGSPAALRPSPPQAGAVPAGAGGPAAPAR